MTSYWATEEQIFICLNFQIMQSYVIHELSLLHEQILQPWRPAF